MTRLSRDTIISRWAIEYDKDTVDRRIEKIKDLFQRFIDERYSREEVLTYRRLVMSHLVGQSKRGSKAQRAWQDMAERDWKLALDDMFPTFEDGKSAPPPEYVEEPKTEEEPQETLTEEEYPPERPDWLKDIQKNISATPVDSDDEFMNDMGLK
jgi:hypothetical protein